MGSIESEGGSLEWCEVFAPVRSSQAELFWDGKPNPALGFIHLNSFQLPDVASIKLLFGCLLLMECYTPV